MYDTFHRNNLRPDGTKIEDKLNGNQDSVMNNSNNNPKTEVLRGYKMIV